MEEPGGRCGESFSVEDVVGGSFVVFVNRSATVGHGQLTSYVAEVLPETHSQRTVDTVVAHACDECSKFTSCRVNKYERYYGPGRRPLAYLLYYMPTVSPACA